MIWFSAAFIFFLGIIVVLADAGSLPAVLRATYAFPGGDKVGHFLLMGGFSLAVNFVWAAKGAAGRLKGHAFVSLTVALLVTAEELSQIFFTTRTFSLDDLIASYLGIFCFGLLAWRMTKSKTGKAAAGPSQNSRPS